MNGDAGTRRTNVGTGKFSHSFAALGTAKLFVGHIGIPHAYAPLNAPTVAQGLVVTIAQSACIKLAAQHLIRQRRNEGDLSDVVVPVLSIYTYEVPLELAAEPITCLRFYEVEVEFHFLRQFPGIIGQVYAERELAGNGKLRTGIGCGGGPQQYVRAQ